MKRTAKEAGIALVNSSVKRLKLSPTLAKDKLVDSLPAVFQEQSSYMTAEFGEMKTSDKVAAFDMDWTLIQTKSGAKFAKNASDWLFWHNQEVVPTKLKELVSDGFRIVVCTNQGGVATGMTRVSDLKTKFQSIANAAGVPMLFLAAYKKDEFRKPCPGMWEHLQKNLNGTVKICKESSFFCGDAAGRAATKTTAKDFSADDLKFASNVGVKFHTPESLFLGQQMTGVQQPLSFGKKAEESKEEEKSEEKLSIIQGGKPGDEEKLKEGRPQEVIMFVGAPGSGKSTFWSTYLKSYERINNDTLKTKEKCMKMTRELLGQGQSVVIDNTNPTADVRARYTTIAAEMKIPIRAIYFDVPKERSMENNFQRKANSHRQHLSRGISEIPIHTFYKHHTVPTEKEGFEKIIKVSFVAGPFENDEDKHAFYNLKK